MTMTPETTTTIGERLRHAREVKGMSYDDVMMDLARRFPTNTLIPSKTTINNLEMGATKKPSPHVIELLCAVYDVKLADIAPEMVDDLVAFQRFTTRAWRQDGADRSESGIRFLVGSPAMAA